MNLFLLKLCWKNIWRNKRRTLLTVNAIAIGVTTLVWLHNYYDAFHSQLIQNIVAYRSGHLLITAKDYETTKTSHTYIASIPLIERSLKENHSIKSFTSRVNGQGMLSSSRGSANVLFKGVNPENERNTSRLSTRIVEGKFLQKGSEKQMVIGRALAKLLKVQLGAKLVVLTQGVDGSIGNELFRLTGIFDTESDMDTSLVLILEEDARALLSLGVGTAHEISILLKEGVSLTQVYQQVSASLIGTDSKVYRWQEVQKHSASTIELNESVNRILMIIILLIAALGITNSILMSILERTREFGVMLAVGTTHKELVSMVVIETLLLCLTGVVLGNFLGISTTLYFGKHGFDLNWLTKSQVVFNGGLFDTICYPVVRVNNSLFITATILLVSLVIAFIPANQIARLRAVKALRSI